MKLSCQALKATKLVTEAAASPEAKPRKPLASSTLVTNITPGCASQTLASIQACSIRVSASARACVAWPLHHALGPASSGTAGPWARAICGLVALHRSAADALTPTIALARRWPEQPPQRLAT